MKKIKSFFATPLKALVSTLCIIVVIAVVGAGAVFAAGSMARSKAIGVENAQNFAFEAAGVDPAAVQMVRTEFDFKQGQFVYEVEFYADGTEYEYWVKSDDGDIVRKEMEIVNMNAGAAAAANADAEKTGESAAAQTQTGSDNQTTKDGSNQTGGDNQTAQDDGSQTGNGNQTTKADSNGEQMSIETAKNTVLSDAGIDAADATFIKEKQDYDDGVSVYELEFYTSTHKYDYEIEVSTGRIISKDVELFKSGAGQNGGAGNNYIGVESAKSAALSNEGLSESDVTFSKAKLENDDGYTVYEIEFYYNGVEYEYTIDAVSGGILEYNYDSH